MPSPRQVDRPEAGGEGGVAQREVHSLKHRYALPAMPTSGRRTPSPPRIAETVVAGAEGVSTELSVDDYLVGGVAMFDAQTGLPPSGEFF
jgi:hypothetical protein